MSPTGLFDYFTHAENPDKTPYNIEDIEVGCGFNLEKFLMEMNSSDFIHEVVDIIEENDFSEFEELVWYARANNTNLLSLIIERTYFFAKYLDSRRYNQNRYQQQKEIPYSEVEDNECHSSTTNTATSIRIIGD